MYATFNRLSLRLTKRDAGAASHQGRCDAEVADLVKAAYVRIQLDHLGAEVIRNELREYGAWDETELADDAQNRHRIVWLAAGDINDQEAA